MKEICLWKINENTENGLEIEIINSVKETETENQLEEALSKYPKLLMADLKIVGRQTDTPGGPLDLLGVDGDGRLVIFELKRGTLTREAVAQIIDYSSYLAELGPDELSDHISTRSGKLGIEKIDDFLSWYHEQFGKNITEFQRPRMVLVGLGVDSRTRRMVNYLAESDLDISLITFHGFRKNNDVYLARRVEVAARPPVTPGGLTKKRKLEILNSRVRKLNLDPLYYEIAHFIRDKMPAAYEWPNQTGYSYGLPELTESGSLSNRVYVSIYVYDSKPGKVQIYFQPRAVEVAAEALSELKTCVGNNMNNRSDGACDIWISSMENFSNLKTKLDSLCDSVMNGWKQKREQQSKDGFESAESIDMSGE